MAGGSLLPIYNNMNGVAPYHPFEADTYADWSLEAGDIVTVSRGGTSYSSPVHSTSLVWRGQPEMHISSTGEEKRDPISRVSMKKYASRGGGMWNNQSLYWEMYSDDGQFHSVLEATSSRLSARMEDFYNGLYSYIEFTASRLYTEFIGLYDGLSSQFEITRSRMYADFMGLYDGLSSEFEVTRSRMYADFMGLYDGLSSEFEVTRSRMYADFMGLYDGLSSEFEVTRSRMYVDFQGMYDGLSSEFEVTRSRMYVDFQGMYDGLSSEFEVTRSRMYAEFTGLYDGLSSEFEVTRSRMYVDFQGMYDGLSSEFEVTRSRMYADFSGMYDGLSSAFEVTRSRMYVDFQGMYDGLSSDFEVTRSRMRADFQGFYDGLSSTFEVTRSQMYVAFNDAYNGLSSEFVRTASSWTSQFNNTYNNLSSRINQEANRIGLVVEGTGSNAKIKAAQIVAGINENGYSGALISADRITLDGNTALSGSLTIVDGRLFTNKDIQAANVALSSGGHVRFIGSASGEYYDLSASDVDEMLVDAEVDRNTNTLRIWKKGDPADNPSITFSKAASVTALTGSWSGGTLTVVTVPDTGHSFVNTPSLALNGNGTDSFSAEMSAVDSAGTTAVRSKIYGYLRTSGSTSSTVVNVCQNSNGTGVVGSLSVGSLYTNGRTLGRNEVTIIKKNWNGGQITFEKSIGTAVTKGVSVGLSGSWTGNTYNYTIYDYYDNPQGVSTGYSKSITYTIPSLVGNWSGSTLTVKPNGLNSPTYVIDIGTGVDGNGSDNFSILATTKLSSESSYTTRKSQYLYIKEVVNGTSSKVNVCTSNSGTGIIGSVSTQSTYNAGVTAGETTGRNAEKELVRTRFNSSDGSYFIEAYENVSGSPSISGTSVSYKLGTTGTNNNTVVQIQTTGSTPSQIQKTATLNVGSLYTAGQNSVNVSKKQWSSGQISFDTSAGTGSGSSVRLTAANTTWNGTTASRVIWDGTAADAQHGVSTDYTVSIDASSKLTTKTFTNNDTYNASDYGYIGFSSVTVNVHPTLSGDWSGQTLTLSSSPSAVSNYVVTFDTSSASTNQRAVLEVTGNGTPSKSGTITGYISVPVKVQQIYSGSAPISRKETNVLVSATGLLDDRFDGSTSTRKITENDTYTPGTGYIGFSEVVVDVSSSASITMIGEWSGTRYTATAKQGSTTVGTATTTVGQAILGGGSSTNFQVVAHHGTPSVIADQISVTNLYLQCDVTNKRAIVRKDNSSSGSVVTQVSLNQYLEGKQISSNGTYYPGSGYMGFNYVTVFVTHNPTITMSSESSDPGGTTLGNLQSQSTDKWYKLVGTCGGTQGSTYKFKLLAAPSVSHNPVISYYEYTGRWEPSSSFSLLGAMTVPYISGIDTYWCAMETSCGSSDTHNYYKMKLDLTSFRSQVWDIGHAQGVIDGQATATRYVGRSWNGNVLSYYVTTSGSSSSATVSFDPVFRVHSDQGAYYSIAVQTTEGGSPTVRTEGEVKYQLGLGTSSGYVQVQIQYQGGGRIDNTPTMLLDTLSVNANGTYTPSSPFIGYSSVSVNVPSQSHSASVSTPSAASAEPPSSYTNLGTISVNSSSNWFTQTAYCNGANANLYKFNVNVPLMYKTITANGSYSASSDGYLGYSGVNVDVSAALTGYEERGGTNPGDQYPYIGDITSSSADRWIAIMAGNTVAGRARVMKAEGGGGSHSISKGTVQSTTYAGSDSNTLDALASKLGAGGRGSLTGPLSTRSGGTTYYGVKVSCGSASKYYYWIS